MSEELNKPTDHGFDIRESDSVLTRFLKYYVNTTVSETSLKVLAGALAIVTLGVALGVPVAAGVVVFQHIAGTVIYVPTQTLVGGIAAVLVAAAILIGVVIALMSVIYTVDDLDDRKEGRR